MAGAVRKVFVSLSFVQLLLGAGCIALGAWLADKPNIEYEFANLVTDSEFLQGANHSSIPLNNFGKRKGQLEVAGYCLISSGAAATIAFMLALLAAFRTRGAVIFLCALVAAMVGVKAAGAVLSHVYKDRVNTDIGAGWQKLQNEQFVPIYTPAIAQMPEGAISSLINYIHVTGQCCGAEEVKDAARSQRWRAEADLWNATLRIPASCCPVSDEFRRIVSVEGPWQLLLPSLQNPACPFDESDSHNVACKSTVISRMQLQQRYLAAMLSCVSCSAYDLVVIAAAVVFALTTKE